VVSARELVEVNKAPLKFTLHLTTKPLLNLLTTKLLKSIMKLQLKMLLKNTTKKPLLKRNHNKSLSGNFGICSVE
jgi:hypothetical protein